MFDLAVIRSSPARVLVWQSAQGSWSAVQVEAIRAGTQPGLTMVVGPPGTGKTDTAVQIMHVLYHNCPTQRTLLIAHSNQVGSRLCFCGATAAARC